MGYRFNPALILRHEFYGGLVHARADGRRWEVTHEDATFLWAVDQTGSCREAVRVCCQVYPDSGYAPDLPSMFGDELLVEGLPPSTRSEALVKEARIDLLEARARTYLRAPLNLSLYPFMVCQLACTFCYVSEEKWVKGQAPASAWVQVMREARDIGVPFVSFLGGDPSLYPGIESLIRACDEIGIKGTITSNGLRMKESLFEAITETDLITPTFSVQSLDDLHKALTGRGVDQTLETIKRVRAAGKSCNVNLVYTEQNIRQVFDVVDFCAEIGVAKLSVGVFVNINGAPVNVPPFSAYRQLYEQTQEYIAKRDHDLVFQVEGCQLYTAYPDLPDPVESEYERLTMGCEAGNGRAEIMHDGTLLPCALLNKHRWGDVNVFENGLQHAWDNGQALARIRSYKNTDPTCNNCSYSGFCNGGCPAMNEKTHGSITDEGDSRCEIRSSNLPAGPTRKSLPLTVVG